MAGVAELIDQAVDLPPGPQLSAALAGLAWEQVPNARLVEVLQARSRQLAHEQAGVLAGLAEIARAVPVAKLPDGDPCAVARAADDFEWASHEIAAGLTWTPTAADRELAFAPVLRELPMVFAALRRGEIDRGKAKVFADHLDPGRGELTPAQIRKLCERFVPQAPRLNTAQLSRRLLRAIVAIDPGFHRRRYRRGVQERGVVLHLDRNGTAVLSGEGLPPDEAAAAAARLDRLAEAAKRAGHPGRLGQITADLYLGMLDGTFYGLTEAQILAHLLVHPRPEDTDADTDDHAETGRDDLDAADAGLGADAEDPAEDNSADEDPAVEDAAENLVDEIADNEDADEERVDESPGGGDSADRAPEERAEPRRDPWPGDPDDTAGRGILPAAFGAPGGAPSPGQGGSGDRWCGERIGIREGVEIRIGLGTLLGLDERPGGIPGLGPVDAEIARRVVAAQQRGVEWVFAVVDGAGHLLLAGPLRRRPRYADPPGVRPPGAGPPGRVRGGVVEIHLTIPELHRLVADPAVVGGWAGVLAEVADRWAERHRLREQLARDPRARFARGALARHVQVRDRTCTGPGCERSARRSDLDHTRDHGRGGNTVEENVGPACKRHHPDKNRGWTLSQPEPGLFVWTSPLGRTYTTRGEPIRPDLPEPDPRQEEADRRDDLDTDDHGTGLDLRILWRPARDPGPPPPPPAPDDQEAPPF
jgi:hypothetical protein